MFDNLYLSEPGFRPFDLHVPALIPQRHSATDQRTILNSRFAEISVRDHLEI